MKMRKGRMRMKDGGKVGMGMQMGKAWRMIKGGGKVGPRWEEKEKEEVKGGIKCGEKVG